MGEGREVRCGETGPRQGSLARRGTLGGGTEQLVERNTAAPKPWIRCCLCCQVCDSSPSLLCPSVSLSLSPPPSLLHHREQ